MKKKYMFIGAGTLAGCAALAGGVSWLATCRLVGVALDREMPQVSIGRTRQRSDRSDPLETVRKEAAAAATRLEAMPHERIEITSRDGWKLAGHWFPCEGARRTVLAMHGWRSSWAKDFGAVADFWKNEGCNVLYAEQRAQGNSEGLYMGFGLLERYDCADWANWINGRVGGKLPICLAGVSMGATTVMMTAGMPLPENVRGVIADCGFTSAHAIWKHVSESKLHLPYTGLRRATVEKLCRKKLRLSPDEASTLDALRQNKDIQVLLVHGSGDRFVPVEMSYENYRVCAAPKQLLVVPGAAHGMSYFVARERYEEAVRQLWRQSEDGQ